MAIAFMCGIIPSLRSKLESSYDVEVIPSDIRAELKEKLTGLSYLAMEDLVDDIYLFRGPRFSNILDTYPNLIEDIYKADDILYDADKDPNFRPKDQEVFSTLNSILGSILSGKEINKEIHSHLSPQLSEFLPEKLESADIGIVACFAYCALIPEGHRIIREILINQWIAEGFLSSTAKSCEELEDVGNRYFNELLRRGTFIDPIFAFGTSSNEPQAAIYSCVMDPIAHRVARGIVARDVYTIDFFQFDSRPPIMRNWGYLSVFSYHRLERPESARIYTILKRDGYPRTFLFFLKNSDDEDLSFDSTDDSNEEIGRSFDSNKRRQKCLLRVLDMSKVQNSGLPIDVRHTIEANLRYLRLSLNHYVERVNFDYGLKYLETLALDGCTRLRELVLGRQFTRLRHLYLTSKQETLNLSGLTTLRILELSHCGQLRKLTDGIKDLTALTTLRIFDCPYLVSLPNTMDRLTNIRELVFHRCPRLFLTNGRCMNTLPNLRRLELIGLHRLFKLPAGLRSATALQYFMIADCLKFKRLPDDVGKLTSLEKFYIYKCPNLLSLPDDMVYRCRLQSLHIRGCPELITKCKHELKSNIPRDIILERDDFQDQDSIDYGPFGSKEGSNWSIKLGKYDRIKQVEIYVGDNNVHGLGFAVEYGSDLNTTALYIGSRKGSTKKLRLAPTEYITHISGSCRKDRNAQSKTEAYIRSLVIHTNFRSDGSGPCGNTTDDNNITTFSTEMLQKGDVITKFNGTHDREYLASIGMSVIRKEDDHQKFSLLAIDPVLCLKSSWTSSSSSTSASQLDSRVPLISPYFTLKMNSVQENGSSKDMLYQDSEPIKLYISKWNILARMLDVIRIMKAKGKEVHRIREDRQEKLRMQEELLQEPKILCSLFPSDYEFDKDTLVQLWMAAGFIKNNVRIEENFLKDEGSVQLMTEDAGDLYFRTLETQQYLLKSRQDILTGKLMYKINPAEVNVFVSGKQTKDLYCQLLTEQSSDSATFNKSSHVSVLVDRINETTFTTLKKIVGLRTLLFIRNYGSSLKQIPSGVFLALKSLQALDLSGSEITQLPSSIQYLILLRYLDLSYTPIKRLPDSIGCLDELQTLKLKGCKHLFKLPEGMKKLTKLRHLDFNVLGLLTYMPRGLGALTELRTLSAFIVDNRDGCNINELKSLNNLSGFFSLSGLESVPLHCDIQLYLLKHKKRLTHLQLRWDPLSAEACDGYTVTENLEPNSCLEELQMLCHPGPKLPHWMASEEFNNLARIVIFKCKNIDLEISLGDLPNLNYLQIVQMDEVSVIDYEVLRGKKHKKTGAFPKLDTLIIDGMLTLESWEATNIKSGGKLLNTLEMDFPKLSTLVIKQCPKLAKFPFLPYLHCLKHAEISRCKIFESVPHTTKETLIINHCPLLEKSCSKESGDWHKIEHVPNIWINHEDPRTLNEDDSENDNEATGSNSDYADDSHLVKEQSDRKDDVQISDAALQRNTGAE